MIKLSQDEQAQLARYVGVAAAFSEYGYSEESIKLALAEDIPEGLIKEAFGGMLAKGLLRGGKWLMSGARAARGARMAGKAIKPGAASFKGLEKLRRGLGMDLTRWGASPGKAAWQTGKGIMGNMIFPGLLKSKSMVGKGIGTGLFAKSMLGGMGGGSTPPPQQAGFGY